MTTSYFRSYGKAKINLCLILDWPQWKPPLSTALPGGQAEVRLLQGEVGDTQRNWKGSRDTAVQSQNTRPWKTISLGSMYTEPLVLSLSCSEHGNSVWYVQKFFFSAMLKQAFLSYSDESLSSTRFQYITTSLYVNKYYLFTTKS